MALSIFFGQQRLQSCNRHGVRYAHADAMCPQQIRICTGQIELSDIVADECFLKADFQAAVLQIDIGVRPIALQMLGFVMQVKQDLVQGVRLCGGYVLNPIAFGRLERRTHISRSKAGKTKPLSLIVKKDQSSWSGANPNKPGDLRKGKRDDLINRLEWSVHHRTS